MIDILDATGRINADWLAPKLHGFVMVVSAVGMVIAYLRFRQRMEGADLWEAGWDAHVREVEHQQERDNVRDLGSAPSIERKNEAAAEAQRRRLI